MSFIIKNNLKYGITLMLLWVAMMPAIASYSRLNRHGIYCEPSNNLLIIKVSPTYYFGDLETDSFFATSQLGGMVSIGYRFSFNDFVGIGVDVNGGMLRGSDNKRFDFQSYIVGGDALLGVKPIPNAGLYINAGISLVYSMITKTGHATTGTDFSVYSRKQYNITPMVPIGLGYSFNIGDRCRLGIELSYRIALMDNERRSLDDYPFWDDKGQLVGKQSKYVDGVATAGVVFGYVF
jgi:hypothetical protein